MIEAEIKARLEAPDDVRQQLERWSTGTPETYSDTYFDTPRRTLASNERELRIRTVASSGGTRHLLTFKDRPVDVATQSKPEVEVLVSDPQTTATILTSLGYPAELAFTKECVNYKVTRADRRFLATLVTVPEIDGSFLEVETQAPENEMDDALAAVRSLLAELGVDESWWTTDTYTDAVRTARLSR